MSWKAVFRLWDELNGKSETPTKGKIEKKKKEKGK